MPIFKFKQFDGNDTIEEVDNDDFDTVGLTEAEIYERDPALLYSGYTFEDIDVASLTKQPTSTKKTATFSLNKDKQITSLGTDASLPDFEVTVNDNDKNVNIQCSTAFYDAVAKPVMCGLSKDATLNINNISISCNHIDYNRDSNCYEYNRVLHIKIGGIGQFSIGKVTIHLHHSKRSIQMQGSAIMPDGSKAPVWFLNTFVKERFSKLAKLKKYDIAALNDAVKRAAKTHKASNNITNNCSQCLRQFSSNSRPTQCIYCYKVFHKTTCLPAHSSSCRARYDRHPSNSAATLQPGTTSTALSSKPSTTEALSSDSSTNPLKRLRIDSTSSAEPVFPVLTINASSNTVPFSSSDEPSATNQQPGPPRAESSPSLLPGFPVITASVISKLPTVSNLNADAVPFTFSSTTTFSDLPKKKPKQKPPSISPESAKIDFLNLELNAAKTRIAHLETTIADRDGTIHIQREKIKVLEESRIISANSEYFTKTPGLASTQPDNLCHSRSSHHCYHPLQHQCDCYHHHTHPQPSHRCSEPVNHSPSEQVSLLNEIKAALSSIHVGIATIADKCIVLKDVENKDGKTSEHACSKKKKDSESDKPKVQASIDPNHIETISVEIVNTGEGDDSFASADEDVPEIPTAPGLLNCLDPTNQLNQLMQ